MTKRDWLAWHRPYDDPDSRLSQRLHVVHEQVRDALDRAAPGPISAISICAGQGRDVLGVLVDHPRSADVTARLVELDPRNAEIAREVAKKAALGGLEVITGDASISSAYDGAVPADLVLVCGVFGNISDSDIARTIEYLPRLCAPGATVIWTRHRKPPDLTIEIRRWFATHGFDEIAFISPAETWGVGTHRLMGSGLPFQPDVRLFTFLEG
jgi:hypothetical protein